MPRPRVAMVLNTMGLGGVPEVAFQLLRHLPPDSAEPFVYALKDGGDAPSRAARQARFEALGVPCRTGSWPGKTGAVAELADWLAEQRIDILHTHSYRPNLYGRMAGALCRPSGLRIVAHYHNDYSDKWDRGPEAMALERRLAPLTDAMIAVSGSVGDHVAARLGIGAGAIEVIPNGVDPARFEGRDRDAARRAFGLEPGQMAIGLVGRVCEQKGQEDLVEAAVLLSRRGLDPAILMAGDIEDRALHARLAARIGEAGLGDTVRFLGHVDDAAGLYEALDLLVAPSRWEGFGLMLVEAMAAEVPVIAAESGAIPEVAGGAALLVPPRDPVRLAEATAVLLSDPARRTGMAEKGRARARVFAWAGAGQRLAALYDRVLEARCVSS